MDRGILRGVRVEYYGEDVPLNQVASINVNVTAGALVLVPWEAPVADVVADAVNAQLDGVEATVEGKLGARRVVVREVQT